MKKLYVYGNDFLFDKHATEHQRQGEKVMFISEAAFEQANIDGELIMEFIDYIWKNPR